FRIKVLIARAKSQTVWFAHNGADPDFDGHIEIPDHLLDDPCLLAVFLAKVSDVWLNYVEQFKDDCSHPAKVPRSGRSAEYFLEFRHLYEGFKPGRIDGGNVRYENKIDVFTPANRQILLQRARITRQILARTKLGRIHENRHDNIASLNAR